MVLGKAKPIGCSKSGDIRLTISSKVDRAGECGIEQTFIANPRGPAMFGQLLAMCGKQYRAIKPSPIHLASSRNTARRFFMISRAAFIWVSNSGSCGVIE